MTVVPFIAESAADAVTQIRAKLGPEAVVLNVRKVPASGISRLWSRPRIEVLAYLPETTGDDNAAAPSRAEVTTPLLDVREPEVDLGVPGLDSEASAEPTNLRSRLMNRYTMSEVQPGEWRSAALLETIGLTPLHAEQVMEAMKSRHGDRAPDSLGVELALTRSVLARLWREARPASQGRHVFVGPPGSGKTTALCKWLTQAVLLDGARARVWRLDVPRANTAEALSVHCEILNAPVERSWNPSAEWPEEYLFLDLPGFEANDTCALEQVEGFLSTLPGASVSLVLNAAYDIPLLQAQIRAFSRLPISHLLFTHLDEEPRWSKLWNFVLGTNYSLSYFGAGQNIPGQFLRATPDLLFPAVMRVPGTGSRT
jgi:flagellar biosynthesis protein FlhF